MGLLMPTLVSHPSCQLDFSHGTLWRPGRCLCALGTLAVSENGQQGGEHLFIWLPAATPPALASPLDFPPGTNLLMSHARGSDRRPSPIAAGIRM